MSNALDNRDGPPASDPGTRDGTGFEPTFGRESGLAAAASFEDGLFGTVPLDGPGAGARESIVGMAGIAGTVVAAGLGVGAWLSLGMPVTPSGSAVLVAGLLVAAAFAQQTRESLTDPDPS